MTNKIVYEVRYNYPYEGYTLYGLYFSKRKAVKRAEAVRAEGVPGSDWVDVAAIKFGDCEPFAEHCIWSSDWPKKKRDTIWREL